MRGCATRWGIRLAASSRTARTVALAAACLVAVAAGRATADWEPMSLAGCPARPEDAVAALALAGDLFDRASEHAATGAHEEAAMLYACSYAIVPHPNALYNLALAKEAAGRLTDACSVLELFLLQAPNASNRTQAEALLAELRAQIAATGGTSPEPPPFRPGVGFVPEESGLSDLALSGWILLGSGVVLAAGGGTVFAVLAAAERSFVLEPVPGTTWRDVAPHQDRYELYSGLEIGFFVLGGAVLAAGVALLVVDLTADGESSSTGMAVPLFGYGMVGLGWMGSFHGL